jgi:uncharacterized circularly permuted ATP-grasp superfamily protein
MTTEQLIMTLMREVNDLSMEDGYAMMRTLNDIRAIKVTYVRNCAA